MIENYLLVIPPKLSQAAVSVDTLLDILTLRIEDMTRQLRAVEEWFNLAKSATLGCQLPR